jgi:hypothetical protein
VKLKLLATVIVATVMGTAVPVRAAGYETMYGYIYFGPGGIVGKARDLCTNSGVIPHGQWLWGYATDTVEVVEWIGCEDGQWVPIQ